jgi:hypothetical protein
MSIYGSLSYDMHGRKRKQLANNPAEFKSRGKAEANTEYTEAAVNHREKYPSGDCFGRAAAKKEENVYTGSYIKGIATMHKSNSVPVGSTTDPKEFATMRRS